MTGFVWQPEVDRSAQPSPPRPNKEGSEGFTKTGKQGPREEPHVTQLVKGEIA